MIVGAWFKLHWPTTGKGNSFSRKFYSRSLTMLWLVSLCYWDYSAAYIPLITIMCLNSVEYQLREHQVFYLQCNYKLMLWHLWIGSDPLLNEPDHPLSKTGQVMKWFLTYMRDKQLLSYYLLCRHIQCLSCTRFAASNFYFAAFLPCNTTSRCSLQFSMSEVTWLTS